MDTVCFACGCVPLRPVHCFECAVYLCAGLCAHDHDCQRCTRPYCSGYLRTEEQLVEGLCHWHLVSVDDGQDNARLIGKGY